MDVGQCGGRGLYLLTFFSGDNQSLVSRQFSPCVVHGETSCWARNSGPATVNPSPMIASTALAWERGWSGLQTGPEIGIIFITGVMEGCLVSEFYHKENEPAIQTTNPDRPVINKARDTHRENQLCVICFNQSYPDNESSFNLKHES